MTETSPDYAPYRTAGLQEISFFTIFVGLIGSASNLPKRVDSNAVTKFRTIR